MENATRITGNEAIGNDRTDIITNARSIIMVTRGQLRPAPSHALSAARGASSPAAAKRRDGVPASRHARCGERGEARP